VLRRREGVLSRLLLEEHGRLREMCARNEAQSYPKKSPSGYSPRSGPLKAAMQNFIHFSTSQSPSLQSPVAICPTHFADVFAPRISILYLPDNNTRRCPYSARQLQSCTEMDRAPNSFPNTKSQPPVLPNLFIIVEMQEAEIYFLAG